MAGRVSFLEMLKSYSMLADPASCGANSADAFDVHCSLSFPDTGFSDHSTVNLE